MAPDSESQSAIFWDRLRPLFSPSSTTSARTDEPQWGLAITVCVLLSCILWLSLTLGEMRTETLRLPVRVVGIPDGQALAEVPPPEVRVQMQGSGLELIRILYNPPAVEVDATTGKVNVEEAISLPQDVRVEGVTPTSFAMKLEPLESRRVPVRSRAQIELAPAYELIQDLQVQPESVDVRGARSIVRGINSWPTDSIEIEDLRDTVEVQVPLADTLRNLVAVDTTQVTILARAGRFAEESREVEVRVTGVPSGQDMVALQPSSIRIRYRVLFQQLFDARQSSEFFATVPYDRIRSDTTGYVEPRVHVPSDLMIRDPEPIPSRLQYYTFVSGN